MKFYLSVLVIVALSLSACNNSKNSKDYVKFDFKGQEYKETSSILISASYNGVFTTVESQTSGKYFWIEIPGNETGTFKKTDANTTMTLETQEGNYDAYNNDGMNTSYTITIEKYDDYIKGTFSGTLEGGASGNDVQEVSGSFCIKVVDETDMTK